MTLKREKTEVVMLPTNEKASKDEGCCWLNLNNSKPRLESYPPRLDSFNWKGQHLYFLSDEKIKEGDWYYSFLSETIGQASINAIGNKNLKKIIATTDESLEITNNFGYTQLFPNKKDLRFYLPQPSQDFKNIFTEEYNKGNVIKWVDVEYEEIKFNSSGVPVTWSSEKNLQIHNELKVNSKNEITIRKIKDSWNREEVIKNIDNIVCGDISIEYLSELFKKQLKSSELSFSQSDTGKKWIHENL